MDSDDKKITQLIAGTPYATDIMPYVSSPSVAPDTKKTTIRGLLSGWIEVSETWTYASANTINVPAGGSTIYKKGMGIRWKQGGGYKYAYIYSTSGDTVIAVTGGTDYTVANAALTDIAYTFTPDTAVGFPVTFNCAAPTWNLSTIDDGSGGQPTAGSTVFKMCGNSTELIIALGASGVLKVGSDNTITVSALPATLPNIGTSIIALGLGYGVFASVAIAPAVIYYVSASSFSMTYPSSIADNTSLAYTNCNIKYLY